MKTNWQINIMLKQRLAHVHDDFTADPVKGISTHEIKYSTQDKHRNNQISRYA